MAKTFDLQEFTHLVKGRVGVITYFNQNSKTDKKKVMGKDTKRTIIEEMERFQQRNSFYGEDFEDSLYEQMKQDGASSESILVALKMLQGVDMENTSYTKNRTGQELRKHQVEKVDNILEAFEKIDELDHRHIKQLLDIIMTMQALEHSDVVDIENKIEKLNLTNGNKDIIWARNNVEDEAHEHQEAQAKENKVEKSESVLETEFAEILANDKTLKSSITIDKLLDVIYKNDGNKHREFDRKEQIALEKACQKAGLNYEEVVSKVKAGKKDYVKSHKNEKTKTHSNNSSQGFLRNLKDKH